jgi:hypothetical protein
MTTRQKLMFLLICVLIVVAPASAAYQECTSTITSNFNGTAIAQGDYIWFTGVLTVKGLGSGPTTFTSATPRLHLPPTIRPTR